jgi:tetratricopeptide (TPR) repeat protein
MPSSAAAVMPDQKLSRVIEMQTVALIIGSVIVLAGAFYAGTKVRILKNALNVFASRNKPELPNYDSTKFPGLSADELVEQALAAERLGNWHEAVARLITAKKRNLLFRDLLFHAGKLCYDHGDFDSADRLLERAIVYGDQVDTANYLRGLIAVGRNDLPAAERFFEAAATAEPFTPGYFYYWGDALRRDQRPNEAIKRYEQAAARTVNEQDAALCRFKARMAKAETADKAELQAEIEKKRAAGPLPVDWLLTEAALRIRGGELPEAVQLIEQARTADQPRLLTLFSSCTSDMLFTEASRNHPEIAAACRADAAPSAPPLSSSPSGTP